MTKDEIKNRKKSVREADKRAKLKELKDKILKDIDDYSRLKAMFGIAMCCDCGFNYGSIDCKGCDFYRHGEVIADI